MANFGSIHIRCNLDTRKALLKPTSFQATKYNLNTSEPTPVDVFGIFPVSERDGDSDAYFVVELPDGRCCYACVEQVQFIKETEEETECD